RDRADVRGPLRRQADPRGDAGPHGARARRRGERSARRSCAPDETVRLAGFLTVAAIVVACTETPPVSLPSLPPLPALLAPQPRPARPVTLRVVGPAGPVADAKLCAARIGGEE